MEPFATAVDVAERWRDLSSDEVARADVLASDASYRIRRRFPAVDARIQVGTLDRMEVAAIVAAMVKRAMIAGTEGPVESQQDVAGPFQRNVRYANPMGEMYLTEDEAALLSSATGAGQHVRSVRLTHYGA